MRIKMYVIYCKEYSDHYAYWSFASMLLHVPLVHCAIINTANIGFGLLIGIMFGLDLGLGNAQNSALVLALPLEVLGLECCSPGLVGQVLASALADAIKLRHINSNI